MSELGPRFWKVFYDVYEALPRQGPGSRASTERAWRLCGRLPAAPVVLDLGCGTGGQTLDLAALSPGLVVALDSHLPSVRRLAAAAAAARPAAKVRPLVADMRSPPFPPGTFDLAHSEGALYFLGVEEGLRSLGPLLKPRGLFAFSEMVWRVPDPPAEIRESWAREYAEMTHAGETLARIARAGFETLGHFSLPDSDWWDDFYTPMGARIREVRPRCAGDTEALAALDLIENEVELHRRYSEWYAYEFFVTRRTD